MKRGLLHHVEIYVSNLEQSKIFWGELLGWLGYEQYQYWDRGVSYKLGATYLVFVQAEEAFVRAGYHRKRVGLNHLAFHVADETELEQFKVLLAQKEIPLLYGDRLNESYAAYFEDPDRIKVELVVAKPLRLTAKKNHNRYYFDPISVVEGDTVKLIPKESEWAGWIWSVHQRTGKEGWVPVSVLKIDGLLRSAVAIKDYSAAELDARLGQSFLSLREEAGWHWCRNLDGAEGWLPSEIF